MSDSLAVTLHASAAETASGSGDAIDLWDPVDEDAGTGDDVQLRQFIELDIIVTAVSGTAPTLDVEIQTSRDGNVWAAVESFAQVTATGRVRLTTGDCLRYVRAVWTIGGTDTPTFTFLLDGTALPTFCPVGDIGHAKVLPSTLTKATKIEHLLRATKKARSWIRSRHSGTIISVGEEIARAVAKMAVVSLMVEEVGINPTSQGHVALFNERDKEVAFLKDIAAGKASADVVDSTPTTKEGTGAVGTRTARGWGDMSAR